MPATSPAWRKHETAYGAHAPPRGQRHHTAVPQQAHAPPAAGSHNCESDNAGHQDGLAAPRALSQESQQPLLPSVILVSRKDRDGFVQCERIEDRRLRILGVPEVRLFHRLFIREDPCSVIALFPVLVIRLYRPDIVPLSLRLSAYDLGLFNGLQPILEHRRVRGTNERIRAPADRNAPVSDCAAWICFRNLAECIHILPPRSDTRGLKTPSTASGCSSDPCVPRAGEPQQGSPAPPGGAHVPPAWRCASRCVRGGCRVRRCRRQLVEKGEREGNTSTRGPRDA